MAFRLREIGSAIFCGKEMYLNLETGRVFAKLSGEFCEAYSKIIQHAREHSPEEATAKHPIYNEFYSAICRKCAIEWCEKHDIKVSKK